VLIISHCKIPVSGDVIYDLLRYGCEDQEAQYMQILAHAAVSDQAMVLLTHSSMDSC